MRTVSENSVGKKKSRGISERTTRVIATCEGEPGQCESSVRTVSAKLACEDHGVNKDSLQQKGVKKMHALKCLAFLM